MKIINDNIGRFHGEIAEKLNDLQSLSKMKGVDDSIERISYKLDDLNEQLDWSSDKPTFATQLFDRLDDLDKDRRQ